MGRLLLYMIETNTNTTTGQQNHQRMRHHTQSAPRAPLASVRPSYLRVTARHALHVTGNNVITRLVHKGRSHHCAQLEATRRDQRNRRRADLDVAPTPYTRCGTLDR